MKNTSVDRLGDAAMDELASKKVGPLASLGHREYRLLLIGRPFITTSSWMRNTVNAFQVYQLTDDARLLGLTFLFQGLPSLVLGFFGGALADMLDRRRLLQVAAVGQLFLALVLAALTASGRIEVWHIYGVTLLGAGLQSATQPAQSALIPSLVPKHHLMNAIALSSTVMQASMLCAPLLGGVLVDVAGAAAAYLVGALLIVPAIVTLAMLRPPVLVRPVLARNFAMLFEGLTFTIRSRILLAFISLDTITMVFGYYPAMMPVIAEDVLKVGATGFGALLAAPSLGSMLGFVGVMLLGNFKRKGAVILLVSIGHALALILFAYSPWFATSFICAAFLGFFDSMSLSVRHTSFQLLAPDEVRGRVLAILSMAAISSNSFGGAYLGLATSFLGVQHALALGGVVGGLYAAYVAVFWRRVWAFRA